MSEYQQDETSFLEALQAGDRAAFAELVDAYSAPMYRLALKILGNQQDAEDVLQETFIKAFHALPEFEGRSKLSTWLYRIATNEALMLLRKRKPEVELIWKGDGDQDDDVEELDVLDWCCLPENELLSAESRQFLEKAVDTLSFSLKVVFLLRDIEGLSIRETAEALDISESAVKVRLMRARVKLREQLSGYFGSYVSEKGAS